MPLTRRQRRIALATALIAILAFAWLLARPAADSDKFYTFLRQHPWLSQVVRVGFVLAGKQNEFDVHIALVTIDTILISTFDIEPDELEMLRLNADQPPPPPVARMIDEPGDNRQ